MEKRTMNNWKLIFYYSDLLCEKIDLHTDAFIERIEALKQGDPDRAAFIEKMMLEPLDMQIAFLANKLQVLCAKGEQNYGYY